MTSFEEYRWYGLQMYNRDDLYDAGFNQIISRYWEWNNSAVNHTLARRSGPFAELLKKKLPPFLPDMKNPCWYDDDNDRRTVWIEYLCSMDSGYASRLCNLYSGNRKTKKKILRCLPYFMLIGQPKSGSTDLFKRIVQHPDVRSSISKEPHWWTRYRHCREKMPHSFTEYTDYFSYVAETLHVAEKSAKMQIITGEGSQSTLWDHQWWWEYPENEDDKGPGIHNAHFIRHILPDVKLLVILRNPVERLFSEYLYFFPDEQKSVDIFNNYVTRAVHSFNTCLANNSLRHCAYKEATDVRLRLMIGLYAVFLKDWMDVFPRKQLLVISLDNYSANQSTVLSKVFKFLGLRNFESRRTKRTRFNQRRPSSRQIGDMLNETRLVLERFYRPFNKALSLLMNDTSFLWETAFT
ncbi:carbohydrate sulfotransferase 15-like [Ylistrum balloti]|uniref:carbohydrate sulfotransferase 15-like n=1 Tax=Ylistrum balloti TaxID=509963 RepID=UPI002905A35B|nr:carbohydrate sulfotransferase 15-like [Ylistrum balloti]